MIININLIPAKTGNRNTFGSLMKDFCQLITDLSRGKTCFRDNDKLNDMIKIDRIFRIIKTITMIRMSKII